MVIVTASLVMDKLSVLSVPATNVTVVCAQAQSVPTMHRRHMVKNVLNE